MKSDRILLSIKPEYADQIERHTKLFEFRKRNFLNLPSEIWVYASSPIRMIDCSLITVQTVRRY